MALADDVRHCLTELLGSAAPEVPDDSYEPLRFFRQWLAERNLGLVPIAEPASFEWAGQWIAVVDGSDGQHARVMFGSPSGVWLDPAGTYDDGAQITAGWMLTPLDLHLPTQAPYGSAAGVGAVTGILIAPAAEAPLVRVDAAEAVPGRGLVGDRYAEGRGTFSAPGRGYELTLVEAEVLDEIELPWEEARRNVVTTGISLNALVGKRFRVGPVECVGRRLAGPVRTWRSSHGRDCYGRSSTAAAFEPTSSPAARSRSATRSPSPSIRARCRGPITGPCAGTSVVPSASSEWS